MGPAVDPDARYERLLELLNSLGPAAVAFSGGVDSTLLLRAALDALGARQVLAVTAVSAFFPAWEQQYSRDLAHQIGARQLLVPCDLLALPAVVRNDPLRCYHCKKALFGDCAEMARQTGFSLMLDGTNLDDGRDYRPGSRAARELGVRSPLAEAGLGKQDIRDLSRRLGLPTWKRPAFACLASRIPYGSPISAHALRQVDRCESALRSLGFDGSRARHHGASVRIEIPLHLLSQILAEPARRAVIRAAKEAGFTYVCLDLEGYRSGSLNEILTETEG